MKSLKAFALLFVLTVLPVSAELVFDPDTGLMSGIITVNGETYEIEPWTNLQDADLSGANLRWTNLRGANLTGADLSNANLSRADLTNADLRGVRSAGITGTPSALPTGWVLTAGYLVGPEANLTAADLAGADLTGADLTGANLDNADFTGANLTDTNFGDAFASVIGLNGLKIVNLQTELAEKDAKITSLEDRMTALEAQVALLANAGAIQQLQEQIAQLSQRPTLEEVQDGRDGSVVLEVDPEGGTVTLGLTIEQSGDLIDWTPIEGELTRTIPIPDGKKFYRFALDKSRIPGQG